MKGVSRTKVVAEQLRRKYSHINYGVWNTSNMSNRQVIRMFLYKDKKKDE